MNALSSAIATEVEAPLRVMVVDDSVVVRGLISRWLGEAGGFDVVGIYRNGRLAVDDIERVDPDVVLLDIEMPVMDGIEALPLILRKKRNCAVIMASTVSRRNAEISLRCLARGALDYVPKPESNRDISTSLEFRREIIEKVRSIGRGAARKPLRRALPPSPDGTTSRHTPRPAASPATNASGRAGRSAEIPLPRRQSAPATPSITLRPHPALPPRLLLIGASTGGPQALKLVASGLSDLIEHVPVLITQHMPATFTAILAEHLARACGRDAAEAEHGEAVRPGRIYVAPGGRHMLLRREGGHSVIVLDDGPMINFCKPSVDPLFTSGAELFGKSALALVLTGMGSDGMKGASDIVAAGGSVIAQDEATSIVWGMPGAVAHAGLCTAVLPLPEIAPRLMRLFSGKLP